MRTSYSRLVVIRKFNVSVQTRPCKGSGRWNEAIRLCALLAEHPMGGRPRTHALLALMLLNAARFAVTPGLGRKYSSPQEQDQSSRDQSMIARG